MSISLAIIFPVLLTIVLLVVQAALWWYASQVALSAAREGADAGRVLGGSAAAGQRQAETFVRSFDNLAEYRDVTATRSAVNCQVVVKVRPLGILPLIGMPDITRQVTAPVERFVSPVAAP
ncbi:hypothetical protein CFP65_6418 [Kitasatospora sp. MMS16-BH015]|uniref:TadE/TadG family type IV pilus assembly protein n=1 Tax=Kitasatospora sp. MMS16-BH015 TaxID=2018025 RepID=UPI000CA13976|nr:TadE/TadG family type IV pilus assembly protein [Kitasatospora sp. MMS16-BH015]AUG81074.1 hypothetical protein CFP65_6418 [Kitasatospora sp. MMS16-BH015]